jgi:hypothetical protein
MKKIHYPFLEEEVKDLMDGNPRTSLGMILGKDSPLPIMWEIWDFRHRPNWRECLKQRKNTVGGMTSPQVTQPAQDHDVDDGQSILTPKVDDTGGVFDTSSGSGNDATNLDMNSSPTSQFVVPGQGDIKTTENSPRMVMIKPGAWIDWDDRTVLYQGTVSQGLTG